MRVLLLKDVSKVGRRGDIVLVKDGFGRNFLLPQGLAKIADESTVRGVRAEERRKKDASEKKIREWVNEQKRLLSYEVNVYKRANEKGILFDSVDVKELVHLLEREGFRTLKDASFTGMPLKSIGVHTVHLERSHKIFPITVHIHEAR